MTEVDKRHGNLLSLYKMSFKCIKSISEHVSFSIALNYIFFIILLRCLWTWCACWCHALVWVEGNSNVIARYADEHLWAKNTLILEADGLLQKKPTPSSCQKGNLNIICMGSAKLENRRLEKVSWSDESLIQDFSWWSQNLKTWMHSSLYQQWWWCCNGMVAHQMIVTSSRIMQHAKRLKSSSTGFFFDWTQTFSMNNRF